MTEDNYHKPVLLLEVIELLHIESQGLFIDATVGAGGHSAEIVKAGGNVLGLDMDPTMLKFAEEKLLNTCPTPDFSRTKFKLITANFAKIAEIAKREAFYPVDGVLMDLGVSSIHFDDSQRGFSFKNPDAPLDMRLDPQHQGVTAADLVNSLDVNQLTNLFELGMTAFEGKKLARRIVNFRRETKINSVADILLAGQFHKNKNQKTNPATKAFMALRIAVNTELENLKEGLAQSFELLKPQGRLVIISFHSGEDRIVKTYFKDLSEKNLAKIITKDPVKTNQEEINDNPRSRSAILRVVEKI